MLLGSLKKLLIINNVILLLKRFYLFLEKGKGREQEKDRNINVREKHQSVDSRKWPDQELNPKLRYVPWLGIQTSKLILWRIMPNHLCHLSHTSQGINSVILNTKKYFYFWSDLKNNQLKLFNKCFNVHDIPLSFPEKIIF